jgi:Fe-Mn family superoxide dismutase
VASQSRVKPFPFTSMANPSGPFQLPPLPYAQDALAPHISAETLAFHYGKHHAGYVTKLNAMVAGTEDAKKSLEEIIKEKGKPFNMAAQTWNHTFYWQSMSPRGGGAPSGEVHEAIVASFGSFDKFKEKFTEAAAGHFGSGWAWLVREPNSNKLEIVQGHDAGNPLTEGKVPIINCDVWEHSYYIDYRNDRAKYLTAWWNLVNWEFAAKNLKH